MTIVSKGRVLTADPVGLARRLEMEAETMHPLQFFREAVHNEIEAGATKVIIDGFKTKQGLLARVSGNGSGMSHAKLISHLATVFVLDKSAGNYGIGARVAALPKNPAGVTFASRTGAGEGMVTLAKHGKVFELKTFPAQIRDEDGELVTIPTEVMQPSHGELSNVKETGTAVILHGDGKNSTWSESIAHQVHNFLSKRYYLFPGDARVVIAHPTTHSVVPFGQYLADHAVADGEVPFADIFGLSGVMFWWVLPKYEDLQKIVGGYNRATSGLGLVVDNEIFDYSSNHMTDFGIQYRSVQSRVVILVGIHGARMDMSRSSVEYPMGKTAYKKQTPWKALGAYFSEHMPEAIDELMSKVQPNASIFNEDLAKKLDAQWMKWIKPVPVIVAKKNEALVIGDELGDAVPAGENYHDVGPEPGPNPNPRPHLAAHRQIGGNNAPGKTALKIVTPAVQFVAASEMPEDHLHIYWAETSNAVMISEEFPPYKREIAQWVEKTDHPKSLVVKAVRSAYELEYAAYIIDANGQRRFGKTPEEIEMLKSDIALYGKALGCQSLKDMIEKYLKDVAKTA